MASSSTDSILSSSKLCEGLENVVVTRRRWCRCPPRGHVCVLRVSQTEGSFNHVFFSCRNYIDEKNPGCGFFAWLVDEGVAERTRKALASLERRLEHDLMDVVSSSMKRLEEKLMERLLQSEKRIIACIKSVSTRSPAPPSNAKIYMAVALIVIVVGMIRLQNSGHKSCNSVPLGLLN